MTRLPIADPEVFTVPDHEAAAALWLTRPGAASDRVVMVPQGTGRVAAEVAVETGQGLHLQPDDELEFTWYPVFAKTTITCRTRLGRAVAADTMARWPIELETGGLPPDYYLVTAEVRRGGRSLLGGRVGCDDLYVVRPGESLTYSVLSVRTGMALWCRDLLHGDLMGGVKAALPHVFSPLNRDTYPQFLKLFATTTGKHSEGNEAGVTGLALAAEAFRKAGDQDRCAFTEGLIRDSVDRSLVAMQAANGGVRVCVNELLEEGIGCGWTPHPRGNCDTNQIGELMRAWVYAMLYFNGVPGGREYARHLSAACRRSADYLVAYGTQEAGGLPQVMRHLTIVEKPDGRTEQQTYYQEGRQCDVYLPRALAGLTYYAYARQVLGEPVPDSWWPVLDNSVEWCRRKLLPNGWFDWQCEDVVEHGCHTFLGNIYAGEAAFGAYLANRLANRPGPAAAAADLARRTYRYVTDDCTIRGIPYRRYFAATDLWVMGYTYWLFSEYLAAVGPEEHLAEWLTMTDRHFREAREWRDLLDRPAVGADWKELINRPFTPADYAYRADGNGMLSLAILGYLAIRHLADVGQPFALPLTPRP